MAAQTAHSPLQTQSTVVWPVCLLNQLLTAMESMTDVTSSHCPSYHKLDKFAFSY